MKTLHYLAALVCCLLGDVEALDDFRAAHGKQ